MSSKTVGWFWTFFKTFSFCIPEFLNHFRSRIIPSEVILIGPHHIRRVFFFDFEDLLPVNQNIVGTKELCLISNQTQVESTKYIHRFFHTQRTTKVSILLIKTKNSFFVSFAKLLQPLIARKISAAISVLILKCSQLRTHVNQQRKHILLLFVS